MEKTFAREILAQQKVAWDYLEAERVDRLRATVTKDVIGSFDSAFAYAQTLPPRMESGFVEFYRALSRSKRQ